jgi:hypothetical protein
LLSPLPPPQLPLHLVDCRAVPIVATAAVAATATIATAFTATAFTATAAAAAAAAAAGVGLLLDLSFLRGSNGNVGQAGNLWKGFFKAESFSSFN